MSVTHIAAPPVVLEDRIIQRCSLCGMKLIDMPKPSIQDEKPPDKPWIPGKFISVSEDFQVMMPFTDYIPTDLCYYVVSLNTESLSIGDL